MESIREHDGLKGKAINERVEKTHRSLISGIFELVAHPFRNEQPLGAGQGHSTHVPLPDPPRGLQLGKRRIPPGLRQAFEPHHPLGAPIRIQRKQFLEQAVAQVSSGLPATEVFLQPPCGTLGHHLGRETEKTHLIRKVMTKCAGGNARLSSNRADRRALHAASANNPPHGSR